MTRPTPRLARALLLCTVLATLPAMPAASASGPGYEVAWRDGGMSAPYDLRGFQSPKLGRGLFAVGYTGGAAAVTPAGVRWRSSEGAEVAGQGFGDLTDDGVEDVVLGQYPGTVRVLDGLTGDEVARRTFPSPPAGLAVGDATGDGRNDLFVVVQGRSMGNTAVTLLDGDGFDPVWSVDLGVDHSFVMGTEAGDLDGDGRADVVFGTYDNGPRVYAFGGDGDKLWDVDLGGTVSNVAIADGGRTVFASRVGNLLVSIDARTGDVRWSLPNAIAFSRLAVGDLDRDGTDDAVWSLIGTSGKSPLFQIHAVSGATGTPLWVAFPGAPAKDVIVGDLDADGRPDVAATTQDAPGSVRGDFVWAYHGGTGRVLWSHPIVADHVTYLSDLTLADVFGDGRPEVVVAPYVDVLLGLTGDAGAEVWRQPVGSTRTDAAVADVDGDGRPEVAEGGTDLHVVVRDGETGAVRWSRDFGGEIVSVTSVPAGERDDLIVAALATVHRVRGTDGAVLWSHRAHGWASAVLPARVGGADRLIVAARLPRQVSDARLVNDVTAGSLAMLDPSTGTPVWQIETPGAPTEMVLRDVTGDGAADLVTSALIPAAGVTAYDGARLATAPVRLWQTATEAGVQSMTVAGDQVLTVQGAPARAVVALDGATGATRWTAKPNPQGVRGVGFADVDGDGVVDALTATRIFATHVTAVSGVNGSVLFDLDAGVSFVKAARWTDMTGDGDEDLLAVSDGGAYGDGGLLAFDGGALAGAPTPLWSYRRINAHDVVPIDLPDGPAWLAYGWAVRQDAIAVVRPTTAG